MDDERFQKWKGWGLVKESSAVAVALKPTGQTWDKGSGDFGYEFLNAVVAQLAADGTSLTAAIPDATRYTLSVAMNRIP